MEEPPSGLGLMVGVINSLEGAIGQGSWLAASRKEITRDDAADLCSLTIT